LIAEAKVEAYRVSARILAQLLRADMLSDWMQRDRCQFMLHRISLVKMRTEVGNRVHSMLDRHCLKCPYPPTVQPESVELFGWADRCYGW